MTAVISPDLLNAVAFVLYACELTTSHVRSTPVRRCPVTVFRSAVCHELAADRICTGSLFLWQGPGVISPYSIMGRVLRWQIAHV
jgi:hypothetical protein